MICGALVMALFPFVHCGVEPRMNELASQIGHLQACDVLRPFAGPRGEDPTTRTETLALLACERHARALQEMEPLDALLVGRTSLGILIGWMTPPGTSSHRRNTGVFQLIAYHMAVNGVLAAMIYKKRHLRILARAAPSEIQDIVNAEAVTRAHMKDLRGYLDTVISMIFRSTIAALCYSIFFVDADDTYIGKSKAERKYSSSATVPGIVMRPVEHSLGARGRIVDLERFRYQIWQNHPTENMCMWVNEHGPLAHIEKYEVVSIRQVRPRTQLHDLQTSASSVAVTDRLRPFQRLRALPSAERERELNVHRWFAANKHRDVGSGKKAKITDTFEWFDWFNRFASPTDCLRVGHLSNIYVPLQDLYIWVFLCFRCSLSA